MTFLIWGIVIAIALYGLHRLALWAEDRGYIYYLEKQQSPGTLGNAFLETQALIEPNKKAMVEALRDEHEEQADSGDPPQVGEEEESERG